MNRGFTLLEVVVAVAILGIGMGVAMQIFSGGLKNVHRISQAHRAMNHAENIMNTAIINIHPGLFEVLIYSSWIFTIIVGKICKGNPGFRNLRIIRKARGSGQSNRETITFASLFSPAGGTNREFNTAIQRFPRGCFPQFPSGRPGSIPH